MLALIKITYSESDCGCKQKVNKATVAYFTTEELAQEYERQSRNSPPVMTDLDRNFDFWSLSKVYRQDSLLSGADDYEIDKVSEVPIDPAPPSQNVERIAYFESEPYAPGWTDPVILIAVLESGERVKGKGAMSGHNPIKGLNHRFGLTSPVS